jgi:tellurite resistance protein TehA-like permease
MTRRLILLVLVIIILLLAVAVGATWVLNHTNPKTTKLTPTPTVMSSVTPTTTASQACMTSELNLGYSNDAGGGAAGSIYSTITLKNSGSRTCTITGYPGVSLVHDTTIQVGNPAERSTTNAVTTIRLSPGGVASATLRQVNNNFDPGVCKDGATQLRVYPPDQTVPLLLNTTISSWCPGFSITALMVK